MGINRLKNIHTHAPCFISACLAGVPCRYDGKDKRNQAFLNSLRGQRLIFECPETLGGLPTPRVPGEIESGDGGDVLDGRARVLNREGRDISRPFIRGAQAFLNLMQAAGATRAYLKSRSPSCGVHAIKRKGQRVRGCGVTAALLTRNGIEVNEV